MVMGSLATPNDLLLEAKICLSGLILRPIAGLQKVEF
jgi:hypothetical protein